MHNQQQILSLCIPAYNAAKYLPKLLSSAKSQTIPFDEILVYNDCSTDDTEDVARQFGAKVINGDQNVGCSHARLRLAQEASSKWIHFHDADDDMLPNFTQLAHKWINREYVPDVILFAYEWRDYDSNELLSVNLFDKQELEQDPIRFTIRHQINPFCGVYLKSRFLEAGGPDLDPAVLYNEDVAMHCKLARFGLSFTAETEVSIINYRVNNSMSRTPSAYQKTVNSQFQVMKKNYELTGKKYKKDIAAKLWLYTRHAAWISNWKLVREILSLLAKMKEQAPATESQFFRLFANVAPLAAVWTRELLNRIKRKKDTYWY
ncbi:MAG: glycosyltransferase [Sphingobacteriaceae bacterium]|nr:glycosyltransferase [Sphingobacteriaceae bacterium]